MRIDRGGLGVVGIVVLVVSLVLSAPAAQADEPGPPTIAWDVASYAGYIGTRVVLSGTYADVPVGSTLRIDRVVGGGRETVADGVEMIDGRFEVSMVAAEGVTTLVAVVSDESGVLAESAQTTLTGRKAPVTLTLTMRDAVKDYRSLTAKAALVTRDGRKPSARVLLQFRKSGSSSWSRGVTVSLVKGAGSRRITPRHDGRFRLVFAGTSQLAARTSPSRRLDNRPPGRVVTLPKGASRPTVKVPAQPRASRAKADARTSKISDAVWKQMKGRTWRSGCPVGRGSLRIVRVSYWAFDGYVRRGEIVVHKSVARSTEKVFTALFKHRTPIRSMYRVDRFGYSEGLKGGDDMRSMRADNTSGFNCRRVVGWTSRMSPHAYGRSIDINPWENPFHSRSGYTPNGSWAKRKSPAAVTWRGSGDPVVKIFHRYGFRWLGRSDLHHFQR